MKIFCIRVARCTNKLLNWKVGDFVEEIHPWGRGARISFDRVSGPHQASFYPDMGAAELRRQEGSQGFVGVEFELASFELGASMTC